MSIFTPQKYFNVKSNNKLFIAIIAALVVGVAIGGIVHYQFPEYIAGFSKNIKLLGTIFIRLVQMIIAPLVFSTLVVGIAKMGDMKMVGRVGGKAMAWFISASLISLLIGLFLVNLMAPGKGTSIQMDNPTEAAYDLLKNSQSFSIEQFVTHIFPKSIFEAFATNYVDFLLNYTHDESVKLGETEMAAILAYELLELIEVMPKNKYVKVLIELLDDYII